MKNKATWLIYLGTFLLTPGVLALEVSLTRIFSVLTYHHLTFVVISLATLGFGIAGSVLSRASHNPPRSRPPTSWPAAPSISAWPQWSPSCSSRPWTLTPSTS